VSQVGSTVKRSEALFITLIDFSTIVEEMVEL
jgi:hypothetical protein